MWLRACSSFHNLKSPTSNCGAKPVEFANTANAARRPNSSNSAAVASVLRMKPSSKIMPTRVLCIKAIIRVKAIYAWKTRDGRYSARHGRTGRLGSYRWASRDEDGTKGEKMRAEACGAEAVSPIISRADSRRCRSPVVRLALMAATCLGANAALGADQFFAGDNSQL